MTTPKILAFAGSARAASFNRKLAAVAAKGAEEAGAEVTLVNLGDFEMPIYNGDLEESEGIPEGALAFKKLLTEHDGLLIASPEYNSAFSPLLKNAIDWASRAESDDEAPLSAYQGKIAAIMATSPGGLGGLRGLVFLRMLLENLGVMVLPKQRAISKAYEAFDEKGDLANERERKGIHSLAADLVATVQKLKAD
jgi:chromate reductase